MSASKPLVYIFLYVADLAQSRCFFEDKLALEILESEEEAVKYDVGGVILALNKAGSYGIDITQEIDKSSLLVFHSEDLLRDKQVLEQRGIVFEPVLTYEIGSTAAFSDPDGHYFTLYEPSKEAMTWPSASKITDILSQHEISGQSSFGGDKGWVLGAKLMTYFFLFIRDKKEALDFYHRRLGLRVIEEDEDAGVVKYDAGGIILATHLIAGDSKCAVTVDLARPKPIAVVFLVPDVERRYQELADMIVFDSKPQQSLIGNTVRFRDPNGHVFYLYEPSAAAWGWPSGNKLTQLLAFAKADGTIAS